MQVNFTVLNFKETTFGVNSTYKTTWGNHFLCVMDKRLWLFRTLELESLRGRMVDHLEKSGEGLSTKAVGHVEGDGGYRKKVSWAWPRPHVL